MGTRCAALIFTVFSLVPASGSISKSDTQRLLDPSFYPDRALWRVPDVVEVGEILSSDPRTWSDPRGPSFVPETSIFVKKLPLGQPGKTSEGLTLRRRTDISFIIPLLNLFKPGAGASFSHSHDITLTAIDQEIDQLAPDNEVAQALQDFQRAPKSPAEATALKRVTDPAAAAHELSANDTIWMVTKVYRASDFHWIDEKKNSGGVVFGCPSAPTLPTLDTTPPSLQATQPAEDKKSSTTPTPVTTTTAKASPNVNFSITRDAKGQIAGGISNGAPATGGSTSANPTSAAKSSCGLASAVVGSGTGGRVDAKNVIVFIQVRPVFVSSRGTLHLGKPTRDDPIPRPAMITRSS